MSRCLHTMYVDKPLVGHQGGTDPLAPQSRAPAEARLLRARLPEQHRGDHVRLPGLLPHDAPCGGDRPEQAARPQGGARWRAGLFAGAGASKWWSCSLAAPTATSSTRSSMPASRFTSTARRRRPGGLQGQGQGVLPHLRLPLLGASLQNAEWEKLSILLNSLTPKLPAPKEEDLSKGILEAIDMDSYRVEKKAAMKIALGGQGRGDRARARPKAAAARPSRSWTGLSNILKASTTSSAPCSPTPTAWRSASATTLRPKSLPMRPTRTRRRTRRTRRAWRTTRRWQGDAAPAEGRHPGLQAVRRERILQALRRRHGLSDDHGTLSF